MRLRYVFSGLAMVAAMTGWGLAWVVGQEAAVQRKATHGDDHRVDRESDFIQITKTLDGEPRRMQTSIVRFTAEEGHPNAGAIVDLIGAVHIGERSYYEELRERFKGYDVVLYELVAPEGTRITAEQASSGGSPISALQGGMKDMLGLEFQLEHIDYLAENFRHADVSPEEFLADMAPRGDGLAQMAFRMMGAGLAGQAAAGGQMSEVSMLVALMSGDRERQLRRMMASQFIDMETSLAGMADASGKSTLLTERNAKAMTVLQDELDKGTRRIGIFYGAGHLPDMAQRLAKDFQMTQTDVEWIDAWDLLSP